VLLMAGRLVRQLGSDMADLEGCHPGGLRACLTGALLANARAGRLDDAADVLDVASRLHIRISAGALQVDQVAASCLLYPGCRYMGPEYFAHCWQVCICARLRLEATSSVHPPHSLSGHFISAACLSQAILPFVTERLRTDILRQAVDTISRQVTTEVRCRSILHPICSASISLLCPSSVVANSELQGRQMMPKSARCDNMHACRPTWTRSGIVSNLAHGFAHGSARHIRYCRGGRRCPSRWTRARCWRCSMPQRRRLTASWRATPGRCWCAPASLVSDSVLTMQIDTQHIHAMQIVKSASEFGLGSYVA